MCRLITLLRKKKSLKAVEWCEGSDIMLRDTVRMMNSKDYKERFKAEYYQTKIRFEKLKAFNARIEAANKTRNQDNKVSMPEHDCPEKLLLMQQRIMAEYLHILEVRAIIERIDL